MESEILVDTSALIAFFIQSESNHIRAKRYFLQHSSKTWVILSTVFDETVTWMRTRVSPIASIQVGTILRAEHRYIVRRGGFSARGDCDDPWIESETRP